MGDEDHLTYDGKYRLRAEALDWLDVEDQVVALDGERSLYLSTNPAGAMLWHSLAQGSTVEQLAGELIATYEIDEAQATDDVRAFLSMVSEQGLLEEVNP